MKVATVSLNQIWENKTENIRLCEEYIQDASERKVDLIIFPEMTLTGFSTNIDLIAESETRSDSISIFKHLANKYSIAIVFGMVAIDNDSPSNKSIFINEHGNVLTTYAKIHPFSFANEDKYFMYGNTLSSIFFKNHQIGLTICYDLRFPEIHSVLANQCDIIINIANWPKKRVDHWNTLLKARAIENQIFMIGVNRIGRDGNDLEYIESSNVYNANGEQLEYTQNKDMKIFDIDKIWTSNFKKHFSTVQDRKEKLYKEMLDA